MNAPPRGGRPGGVGLVLLVAVLLGSSPCLSRNAPLTSEAAWAGRFMPERTTEIRVGLLSDRGGPARIEVHSGALILDREVDLEAGKPLAIVLPVRPGRDGRVQIQARLPDGRDDRSDLRLDAMERDQPLLVATRSLRAPSGWLPVDVDSLPALAEGYGPVSALAMTPADLGLLSPRQIQALDRYLGDCGSLALPGINASDLQRIRSASGCGGDRIRDRIEDIDGALNADPADMLASTLASNPDHWTEGPGTRVAFLLGAYALVLALLTLFRSAGAWVLAVPPVTALILWQALPHLVPAATGVTWAVAVSGDQRARTASLIRTQGDGHGPRSSILDPTMGLPTAVGPGPQRLELAESGIRVTAPRLLSRSESWIARGLTPAPRGLRLDRDGDLLMVQNDSGTRIQGAWLLASGSAHPLPDLGLGDTPLSLAKPPAPDTPPPHLPPDVLGTPGPSLVLPWPVGQAPMGVPGPVERTWLILLPAGHPS